MSVLNLNISSCLLLLGEFVSFCSRAFSCSVNLLVLDFASFSRDGFVDRYCLNLVFSWNILSFPYTVMKILLDTVSWAGIYGLIVSA